MAAFSLTSAVHSWNTFATLCLIGAVALTASEPAAARSEPVAGSCGGARVIDPFRLYGDEIRFAVMRNGDRVGTHRVTFERSGSDLIVRTDFTVDVRLLGLSLYSYRYDATDVWRDGCLVSLRSSINDDGQSISVQAARDNDRLRITGPKGMTEAPAAIFPTHHWHPGVIGSSQVLNTITGTVDDVEMIDRGTEIVSVGPTLTTTARHFAYTGKLTTNVWYDDGGRWVKMRFSAKDGSQIEYVCEACGVDHTALRK